MHRAAAHRAAPQDHPLRCGNAAAWIHPSHPGTTPHTPLEARSMRASSGFENLGRGHYLNLPGGMFIASSWPPWTSSPLIG
jgi:hypothetical protein